MWADMHFSLSLLLNLHCHHVGCIVVTCTTQHVCLISILRSATDLLYSHCRLPCRQLLNASSHKAALLDLLLVLQDTKKVLAEVREAKFLTQEQQEALTTLNSHLAAAKAETFNATQAIGELEQQAQVQQAQEQHLLDELSRSQVWPLPPDLHDPGMLAPYLRVVIRVPWFCNRQQRFAWFASRSHFQHLLLQSQTVTLMVSYTSTVISIVCLSFCSCWCYSVLQSTSICLCCKWCPPNL